jgi:hypothetical protein
MTDDYSNETNKIRNEQIQQRRGRGRGQGRRQSHRPTLVHIKNTGGALAKTNEGKLELFIRDMMQFSAEDALGITKKPPRIQARDDDFAA